MIVACCTKNDLEVSEYFFRRIQTWKFIRNCYRARSAQKHFRILAEIIIQVIIHYPQQEEHRKRRHFCRQFHRCVDSWLWRVFTSFRAEGERISINVTLSRIWKSNIVLTCLDESRIYLETIFSKFCRFRYRTSNTRG